MHERPPQNPPSPELQHEQEVFDEYLSDLNISAKKLRGKNVADIGAGARLFGAHLLREGITDRIYSIDPKVTSVFPEEREMLSKSLPPELKKKLDEMTYEAGREDLPLEDESIDILLNHGAMPGAEWYKVSDIEAVKSEVEQSFSEAVRVLKPGGEARLYPLIKRGDGWGTAWIAMIREALDACTARGFDVRVQRTEIRKNDSGSQDEIFRIIIKKSSLLK